VRNEWTPVIGRHDAGDEWACHCKGLLFRGTIPTLLSKDLMPLRVNSIGSYIGFTERIEIGTSQAQTAA
jgi:hypothetical protein